MPDTTRFTALIDYGHARFAAIAGQSPPPKEAFWSAYEEKVCPKPARSAPTPAQGLTSLFSLINLPGQPSPADAVPARVYAPVKLSLDGRAIFPTQPTDSPPDLATVWAGFEREFAGLPDDDPALRFEAFYHLYLKYTWAVPVPGGVAGIPLFEQWKAVAALAFATRGDWQAGPSAEYTLLGGDIPGIQDFVYTITGKGAAKGLRGRSFFLQLLGDAVVRRLLNELSLSPANLIYNAGGNFILLAPAIDAVAATLTELQTTFDRVLLEVFEGDLSLCLARRALPADALGTAAFSEHTRQLKKAINAQKGRRFSTVAKDEWAKIFEPQGKPGNRHCVICQRPLGKNEGQEMEDEPPIPGTDEKPRRCKVCDSFKNLAETIGKPEATAMAIYAPGAVDDNAPLWQKILYRISRLNYDFKPANDLARQNCRPIYLLNDTDFLAQNAHGFRFAANITPRVTWEDIERWKKKRDAGKLTPEEAEEKNRPEESDIRAFDQLAEVAAGVKRVGILRMDVDNLGQVMTTGLPERTMAGISALSRLTDTFFSGRLNRICAEINAENRHPDAGEDRGDRLYVIYAGGDDLFVVGSWDLMPLLAAKIRSEFKDYVADNPHLHISGGITLEDRKFPLYQAAERAGEAEDVAKAHKHPAGPNGTGLAEKDAVTFLGMTLRWQDWTGLEQKRDDIRALAESGDMPRGVTQLLQNIYAQYQAQLTAEHERLQKAQKPIPPLWAYQACYGPWMWRQVYALTRLANRTGGSNKTMWQAKIKALQVEIDTLGALPVRQTGLAARWVELLTRKEQDA